MKKIILYFGKENDGSICAFFLNQFYVSRIIPGQIFMTCYAHIGQHSDSDILYPLTETRPAKKTEYLPLLAELKNIYGDVFQIVNRPYKPEYYHNATKEQAV